MQTEHICAVSQRPRTYSTKYVTMILVLVTWKFWGDFHSTTRQEYSENTRLSYTSITRVSLIRCWSCIVRWRWCKAQICTVCNIRKDVLSLFIYHRNNLLSSALFLLVWKTIAVSWRNLAIIPGMRCRHLRCDSENVDLFWGQTHWHESGTTVPAPYIREHVSASQCSVSVNLRNPGHTISCSDGL